MLKKISISNIIIELRIGVDVTFHAFRSFVAVLLTNVYFTLNIVRAQLFTKEDFDQNFRNYTIRS